MNNPRKAVVAITYGTGITVPLPLDEPVGVGLRTTRRLIMRTLFVALAIARLLLPRPWALPMA
jgi:hypothetical protein